MLDYSKFEDVFPADCPFPYDRAVQHAMDKHRKSLDGILFIDRVMTALGVEKAQTYPPKSDNALRQLHRLICETPMSTHHKQSLYYYILLDFDMVAPQNSPSEEFSNASGMPINYQIFMKGLWLLDRRDFQRALEYVAHPSLNPDFPDAILVTFVRHAVDDDYTLALSYYYSVRPNLKSSIALELLFDAMTRTNVAEALLFSRTHPLHTREQLFYQWIRLHLQEAKGESSKNHYNQFSFMHFDSIEEAWFEEYLSTGEGKNLKRAKDALLMRKITCDRFADIDEQKASGQWAAALEGIKRGIDGRTDQIMQSHRCKS